jgi:hypothetical protein
LLALESATAVQLEELIAIAEERGVPLAELIEEAVDSWLAKELEEPDEGDA